MAREMQKQKAGGGDSRNLPLFEEQELKRRDFLRMSIGAGVLASLRNAGLAVAQPTPRRTPSGYAQTQGVFEGVYGLEGGGELLMGTLPDGTVRGSRDDGSTRLQGRVRDNTLFYRWWNTAGEGDHRDAQPNERGTGQAVFKTPMEIAGVEKTEDGSTTRSWSAKSKPESNGILSANKPFIGAWTNGRGDFLAFSQQYDGGMTGLHTPARGLNARLRGFAREGRLEYKWWAPRNPNDPYDRTLLTMRGSGILSVTSDGRLQNEWATEGNKKAKRREVLDRVNQASQEPQAKNMVIPDLNDATFLPFVRGRPLSVVDFWAPWCGPCKSIAPHFEQMAGRRPDVACGRLNVDIGQRTKQALNVTGIPQIIFFRNGMEVHRVVGAKPEELALAFAAFR
jgi:thioredoxin